MTDPGVAAAELFGAAGLVGLSVWALQRPAQPVIWREARFPDDLESDQTEALLRHVAGLRRGPVVFRIDAEHHALRFFLGAPSTALQSIAAGLSGIAPEVRLDEFEPLAASFSTGLRAWWTGRWPLLRTDQPEAAIASLLGSLASVGPQEHVCLSLHLSPVHRVRRPPTEAARRRGTSAGWPGPPLPEARELREIQTKLRGPLLRVEIVVAVRTGATPRAAVLQARIAAALRTYTGPRGGLRTSRLRGNQIGQALQASSSWARSRRSTLVSPSELVALTGWPSAAPRIPGIRYGVGPRLMPPAELPATGRIFARSTWPGMTDRSLAQPVIGGLQHTAIIGPTGSGKSVLVARLVEQDLLAGRGALVIDAKGDLVDDLLARIPEDRQRDVVLLDPAAGGPQPGLRLFPAGGEPELTSDLIVGALHAIYADAWGIRTAGYLRLGLTTLAHDRSASLPELSLLFHDPGFRGRVLAGVADQRLRSAWQRFDALSAADQATQIAPALTKLDELVGRRSLRVVLGQAQPRLHFGEVLARGRIVLVRLPPGMLGMPATRLLGSLVLWQFLQAVEARAALPADKRHPFMAYVDEVAALGSLPLPLDHLLERARSHGAGLTIAPQSLGQLTPALRSALLANVGSLVAFRLNHQDATAVATELATVTARQLQHLEPFEVALRLSLRPGEVTPVVTGRTLPLEPATGDAAAVRRMAAERYGLSLDAVDAQLDQRAGVPTASDGDDPAAASLGTRRRQS